MHLQINLFIIALYDRLDKDYVCHVSLRYYHIKQSTPSTTTQYEDKINNNI